MKKWFSEETHKSVHLQCACSDFNHIILVTLDDWSEDYSDEDPQPHLEDMFGLTISAQLNHYKGFWGRLIEAFRFVFKLGPAGFDTGDVGLDGAKKIKALIEEFEEKCTPNVN